MSYTRKGRRATGGVIAIAPFTGEYGLSMRGACSVANNKGDYARDWPC
jgi:hypothetical protein